MLSFGPLLERTQNLKRITGKKNRPPMSDSSSVHASGQVQHGYLSRIQALDEEAKARHAGPGTQICGKGRSREACVVRGDRYSG